ncbi:uncharacterized protein PHALS_09917 [Plasmopara halstedii]|uniref:Uncharacterized protein n=1 Tax=Plasmopara halstedii TaxID=4781 RepID=A0A0P1AFR3_PLAHL|nr:uncharacterized protein PHALS_09917 [Plasmopara halstedii]CEG39680.1 hypothetical protein PHALS_09917 [Plasmopara halstedii]|eukprot:XP_024576049.1 hypothetical protein PHALS_09917 [Plasmopara halstedii]
MSTKNEDIFEDVAARVARAYLTIGKCLIQSLPWYTVNNSGNFKWSILTLSLTIGLGATSGYLCENIPWCAIKTVQNFDVNFESRSESSWNFVMSMMSMRNKVAISLAVAVVCIGM